MVSGTCVSKDNGVNYVSQPTLVFFVWHNQRFVMRNMRSKLHNLCKLCQSRALIAVKLHWLTVWVSRVCLCHDYTRNCITNFDFHIPDAIVFIRTLCDLSSKLKVQVQHLLDDFHPILLLVSQLFPTHCQLYHTVSCNQSNGLDGLYPAWPHCPDHSWSLNQPNIHSIVHRDVIYCGTVTFTRDFAEWCICALGNPMLPTWKCHIGFFGQAQRRY